MPGLVPGIFVLSLTWWHRVLPAKAGTHILCGLMLCATRQLFLTEGAVVMAPGLRRDDQRDSFVTHNGSKFESGAISMRWVSFAKFARCIRRNGGELFCKGRSGDGIAAITTPGKLHQR